MELKSNRNSYYGFLVSVATLFILLIGSFVFYKERIFFNDPSFVVFQIINTKNFLFSEFRYGAFITQMFPLIGTYLKLPLKAILIAYSASFYIFYFVAACIIGFKWKQYLYGILIALYFTLMASDVYFWPNNEVHQGVVWLMLFFAYYSYLVKKGSPLKIINHLVLAALLAIAVSCHLIVFFPLLFYWIYIHAINKKNLFDQTKVFWYYSVLMGFLMIAKFIMSLMGSYDAQKLGGIGRVGLFSFFEAFVSGHAKTILKQTLMNYSIIIPMIFLGLYSLIKEKKLVLLVLVLGSAIVYFAFVCITYPKAFERNLLFYMESEWQAFSIIITTPFVLYFLNENKSRWLVTVGFIIIFGIRLFYIGNSVSYFSERFDRLEELTLSLENENLNKVFVKKSELTKDVFFLEWGIPIETIMLSKLNGMEPQVTCKIADPIPHDLNDKRFFHSAFSYYSYDYLNPHYFTIDTTQHYTTMDLEDLVKP